MKFRKDFLFKLNVYLVLGAGGGESDAQLAGAGVRAGPAPLRLASSGRFISVYVSNYQVHICSHIYLHYLFIITHVSLYVLTYLSVIIHM